MLKGKRVSEEGWSRRQHFKASHRFVCFCRLLSQGRDTIELEN